MHNDSPKAFLIIEKGSPHFKQEILYLDQERVLIGRATDQQQPDISFSSPYISRRHLEIARLQDKFTAIDFASKHGTRLNGKLLEKGVSYELIHGDRISLAANEAILVFCLGEQPDETISDGFVAQTDVILNEERQAVLIEGELIELTGNLYELFRCLYIKRGGVVRHAEIKKIVWSDRQLDPNGIPLVGEEEISTLVRRLRERLGPYPYLISNVRGCGYMLK